MWCVQLIKGFLMSEEKAFCPKCETKGFVQWYGQQKCRCMKCGYVDKNEAFNTKQRVIFFEGCYGKV